MKKFRLLRVISSVDPRAGGPIEGIRQLNAPLESLGFEVEIACCDAEDSAWLEKIRSEISNIHVFGPVHRPYCYSKKLSHWLTANAHRFDAVIVHGLWQYIGLAVRSALRNTSTPYYVFTHGMLDPWFKHTYPLKHLKKWMYWPWGEYRVLRDAKAVIFTSEEEKILARESFWLYRVTEEVTNYGTSTPPERNAQSEIEFIQRHPELTGKRIVLFLGRIHPKKGCDLLIKAFSAVAHRDQRLHLMIAGPDQTGLAAELKKLSNELGLSERITWTGMLQGQAKWDAFHISEIFALPSHQENFGIVVAEALACSKPVILTDKVNIWREIVKDKAGFVSCDTEQGIESSLNHWLDLDLDDFAAMKMNAIDCFTNRFHISRAALRFKEIVTAH